jgi:alkylation response protein AidB-like acyl-CoA dehydrogenase
LVGTRNEHNEPSLVAIALNQPCVTITREGWSAVGMARTVSVDVIFEQAEGHLVGSPRAYLTRPGFWHGGGGIASCWYGAASAIGEITRRNLQAKGAKADPHQLAHLGAMEVALAATKALLRETAQWIDTHPTLDARRQALRARLSAEASAVEVMSCAGRALGAGPLCKDAHLARLMADLPVFLRQSHAEKDLTVLGEELVHLKGEPWAL